jgi:hypothetical protein
LDGEGSEDIGKQVARDLEMKFKREKTFGRCEVPSVGDESSSIVD